MTPAPPLDCSVCDRRIGKTAGHYLLDGKRLACTRCIHDRSLHGRVYPDCPHHWHDLLDHLESTGTRAGIAAVLGLWPNREESHPMTDAPRQACRRCPEPCGRLEPCAMCSRELAHDYVHWNGDFYQCEECAVLEALDFSATEDTLP